LNWTKRKERKTHPCVPLYFGQFPEKSSLQAFTFSFLSFISTAGRREKNFKDQSLLGNFWKKQFLLPPAFWIPRVTKSKSSAFLSIDTTPTLLPQAPQVLRFFFCQFIK